jgi:hypothetical protein
MCLDIFGEHATHCREISDFKYRHDLIRDMFFDIFGCVRISEKKEALQENVAFATRSLLQNELVVNLN